MKVLGICIGASTISTVQLETPQPWIAGAEPSAEGRPRVIRHSLHPHGGDPRQTLSDALAEINPDQFDRIAVTGRRFRHFVNLSQISEPEAVEYAYRHVKPEGVDCPAVISAGGETFMAYVLNGAGQIANVLTGNKCASGTGEFFLQQLRRLNVPVEAVGELADTDSPYRLSGRCSVFCKSDCTHATNKGVPIERVTAGLCRMMSNKILELLKNVEKRNVMITGGTVRNPVMVRYLEEEIPGLIVPAEAPYFEALGAALWALTNETRPFTSDDSAKLFLPDAATFDTLPRLSDFEDAVAFKDIAKGEVAEGDVCILGLDVGSTTTKAVLMRTEESAILASVYLKTNGNPVGASRECYRSILDKVKEKIDPEKIEIIGLGVCGSGRQIAGLHGLTDGVINEIIAHAAAAVYFDPEVDTILEIGGQDAKYTYITNGVPSDYAMNEACSAGTGSFLEESALETLGIPMEGIAEIAVKGERPPNFNDQCAAFISSDIKTAIHDGVRQNDVVAGLVYSISMNYCNRVKGNRPVGEKIFMQGGVCYNRAVPLAMASILGKPIVVPPEPGLMGAFGVALEVEKRIDAGLMEAGRFDLQTLIDRDVKYGKSFTCKGGKERCDRHCEIAAIDLEGKKYPFGGACNRYYNLRRNIRYDIIKLDLVGARQRIIFEAEAEKPESLPENLSESLPEKDQRPRIGFNRSFLVNTYFPLYATFFSEIGFEPVIPDEPSEAGIDRRNAPFCFPAELAHGFFHALIAEESPPEYLFLPHFKAVPTQIEDCNAQVCPLVQGETFYLKTTFKAELDRLKEEGTGVISPLIDLTKGLHTIRKPLVSAAAEMGVDAQKANAAVDKAIAAQAEAVERMKRMGKEALAELEADPERIAAVIFARPYSGFAEEAHMGIPRKLASRGVMVIPMDFLPYEEEPLMGHMYWGLGQTIMKAAALAERHPQLFGVYITNFSCGPDSFIITYFRNLMGRKPALTLELDSHTADAGLETRIEAFLDVVAAYRQQQAADRLPPVRENGFVPAETVREDGRIKVIASSGEKLAFTDPRVVFLTPSMGRYSTEAITTVFRAEGINAVHLAPADEAVLKLGRANTTCKECLPLQLTTGGLLDFIRNRKKPDEVLVYFMATASGPCRFGQYSIFMQELIKRHQIPDVAFFSLSGEDSYSGMSGAFERRAWWAVLLSDAMEDMRAMLLANAVDPGGAVSLLDQEWEEILFGIQYGGFEEISAIARKSSARLKEIPLSRPVDAVPKVALTGEIYVRRDGLSRQYLTEKLAEKGFAVTCSPIAEWVLYCDYLYYNGICGGKVTPLKALKGILKKRYMSRSERRLKSILAESGLIDFHPVDIEKIIRNASPDIGVNLTGEAVLTVGASLAEIATDVCGVIAIGPFGCMPNRLSESILATSMVKERKLSTDPGDDRLRATLTHFDDLPFFAIETDGSPFPQLVNAKLETFCLRAERLHRQMLGAQRN